MRKNLRISELCSPNISSRHLKNLIRGLYSSFPDIEKRKSFADMKLAEVVSGGQQWNFENLPEEPSTPCDDEAIDEPVEEDSFMTKNGVGDSFHDVGNVDGAIPGADEKNGTTASSVHCNGHEVDGNSEAITNNATTENGDKNAAAVGVEAASNGSPSAPPASRPPIPAMAANAERKPDPVTEIAPELQVKIADLGNACWVVSCCCSSR